MVRAHTRCHYTPAHGRSSRGPHSNTQVCKEPRVQWPRSLRLWEEVQGGLRAGLQTPLRLQWPQVDPSSPNPSLFFRKARVMLVLAWLWWGHGGSDAGLCLVFMRTEGVVQLEPTGQGLSQCRQSLLPPPLLGPHGHQQHCPCHPLWVKNRKRKGPLMCRTQPPRPWWF